MAALNFTDDIIIGIKKLQKLMSLTLLKLVISLIILNKTRKNSGNEKVHSFTLYNLYFDELLIHDKNSYDSFYCKKYF